MSDFSDRLLAWYRKHGRDLVWRRTADPYSIWVSEIMLQQTTVAAVTPFYERWMARFPTVEALASASVDEVLEQWQGLGYYRRARMLYEGAKRVTEFGFPVDAAGWREVPGVGPYTAGAIASISLGEATPVVDGNVERVYARLNADASPSVHKAAWDWATSVLRRDAPAEWNQAVMELGATVCTYRQPLCGSCPVRQDCRAFALGDVTAFPTAKAKVVWRELEMEVWIPESGGMFGLRRIPEGEWWAGMWEFARSVDADALAAELEPGWVEQVGRFRHTVTNHKIWVAVSLARGCRRAEGFEWVSRAEVETRALPAPQRKAWGMVKDLVA
jgi:A/G-specific adenine glycosylase